ncbi:radical SAM protein [bacterium]|nr:radical SAM protein [bacterium]
MANIFLTPHCGRNCAFCFAKEGPWSDEYQARELSLDEVECILETGDRSVCTECGFIGGEPLTYKNLSKVIRMCLDRGIRAKVFTSGSCVCPEGMDEFVGVENLSFIVNVSPPHTYEETRMKNLDAFFKTFGGACTLSYTLSPSQPDGRYLVDYILKYGLSKHIRVGIAVPMIGGGNEHVAPTKFREAALAFIDLARYAARFNISLGTDCGFVACMFTEREIGELQWLGAKLIFTCGPVMDIGPDYEVWHCFPLARIMRVKMEDNKMPIGAFKDAAQTLREHFRAGVFERCSICDFRRKGICMGGCLGHIIPSVNEGISALSG